MRRPFGLTIAALLAAAVACSGPVAIPVLVSDERATVAATQPKGAVAQADTAESDERQDDAEGGVSDGGDTSADTAADPTGAPELDGSPVPPVEAEPPPQPSDTSVMVPSGYLTAGMTPKSVVANGTGLVIANNMMYQHTVTLWDAETHEVVATIDDSVEMALFGIDAHPGLSQGAPVEAVWTDDGRYAYVSQYTMYGQGFGVEGFDACSPADGVGGSYVYRLDSQSMEWDQVIAVGAVPKYVDLTPDQSSLLVSNWCDSTLSVVDVETAQETRVIPLAAAPRGIEVMPDNRTAYVTAMYADQLFKVDLVDGTSEVVMTTTNRPRHLNLSDDGRWLYLATSGGDTVYKIDTETDEIVDQVVSGREPRSMTLSPDGTALYVVNYFAPSVAKIRTSDMTLLQTEPTDATPIGVTYEPTTHSVWVASYGGAIHVFDDTVPAGDGLAPDLAGVDQAGTHEADPDESEAGR